MGINIKILIGVVVTLIIIITTVLLVLVLKKKKPHDDTKGDWQCNASKGLYYCIKNPGKGNKDCTSCWQDVQPYKKSFTDVMLYLDKDLTEYLDIDTSSKNYKLKMVKNNPGKQPSALWSVDSSGTLTAKIGKDIYSVCRSNHVGSPVICAKNSSCETAVYTINQNVYNGISNIPLFINVNINGVYWELDSKIVSTIYPYDISWECDISNCSESNPKPNCKPIVPSSEKVVSKEDCEKNCSCKWWCNTDPCWTDETNAKSTGQPAKCIPGTTGSDTESECKNTCKCQDNPQYWCRWKSKTYPNFGCSSHKVDPEYVTSGPFSSMSDCWGQDNPKRCCNPDSGESKMCN